LNIGINFHGWTDLSVVQGKLPMKIQAMFVTPLADAHGKLEEAMRGEGTWD
jgi:hypothetical protein